MFIFPLRQCSVRHFQHTRRKHTTAVLSSLPPTFVHCLPAGALGARMRPEHIGSWRATMSMAIRMQTWMLILTIFCFRLRHHLPLSRPLRLLHPNSPSRASSPTTAFPPRNPMSPTCSRILTALALFDICRLEVIPTWATDRRISYLTLLLGRRTVTESGKERRRYVGDVEGTALKRKADGRRMG